jgi:hypothetical protein
MDSYLNASAPATIKLLLESLQPKQTFSPLWRLVEEGPIMPSRAPFEIPGDMRTFAEHSVEQAKVCIRQVHGRHAIYDEHFRGTVED